MKLRKLFTDDDAVSPVIGVILMVAITVILAAVVGAFITGFGSSLTDNPPQASFDFEYDSSAQTLTVTHDGGDTVNSDLLSVTNGSTSKTWTTISGAGATDVGAGDSITLSDSGDWGSDVLSDMTIRVIWESDDGSDTATLGKWEGPDA